MGFLSSNGQLLRITYVETFTDCMTACVNLDEPAICLGVNFMNSTNLTTPVTGSLCWLLFDVSNPVVNTSDIAILQNQTTSSGNLSAPVFIPATFQVRVADISGIRRLVMMERPINLSTEASQSIVELTTTQMISISPLPSTFLNSHLDLTNFTKGRVLLCRQMCRMEPESFQHTLCRFCGQYGCLWHCGWHQSVLVKVRIDSHSQHFTRFGRKSHCGQQRCSQQPHCGT